MKPNLQHLRILGCTAYVHVPAEKRIKLDSHTMKGQHIGYCGTNQWKVWIPDRNEVVISRDVVFDEEKGEQLMTEVPAEGLQVPAKVPVLEPIIHDEIQVLPGPPDQYPSPQATIQSRTTLLERQKSPSPPASEASEASDNEELQPESTKGQKPPAPPSHISERIGKGQHGPRFGETVAKLARSSDSDNEEEPMTFREATSHSTRGKEWEKAIMDEYNSIMRNNTWKLVPRPTNRQVITCK